MRITALRQLSDNELELVWDSGPPTRVPMELLRDLCPCAGCAGESVLLREYVPPPADRSTPGRYRLIGAEQVGGYALKLVWGDGHDLGLYTWERLHEIALRAGGGK